jgi:hypothetical protein
VARGGRLRSSRPVARGTTNYDGLHSYPGDFFPMLRPTLGPDGPLADYAGEEEVTPMYTMFHVAR